MLSCMLLMHFFPIFQWRTNISVSLCEVRSLSIFFGGNSTTMSCFINIEISLDVFRVSFHRIFGGLARILFPDCFITAQSSEYILLKFITFGGIRRRCFCERTGSSIQFWNKWLTSYLILKWWISLWLGGSWWVDLKILVKHKQRECNLKNRNRLSLGSFILCTLD